MDKISCQNMINIIIISQSAIDWLIDWLILFDFIWWIDWLSNKSLADVCTISDHILKRWLHQTFLMVYNSLV